MFFTDINIMKYDKLINNDIIRYETKIILNGITYFYYHLNDFVLLRNTEIENTTGEFIGKLNIAEYLSKMNKYSLTDKQFYIKMSKTLLSDYILVDYSRTIKLKKLLNIS